MTSPLQSPAPYSPALGSPMVESPASAASARLSPFDEIVSSIVYKHAPLKSPRSIRLLNLKRGSKDGLLQCGIVEASLDNPPPYEALSYSWDAQLRDKYISCNGQAVPVTANCAAALKQLCPTFKSRLLWIDAVCIDQFSLSERNHQVGLMDEIYRSASQAIVWLGPGNSLSDSAFHFLHKVASLQHSKSNDQSIAGLVQHYEGTSKRDSGISHKRTSSNSREIVSDFGRRLSSIINRPQVPAVTFAESRNWAKGIWADESKTGQDATEPSRATSLPTYPIFLNEILQRSWFRRMWTVQEVALAHKCTVYCGKQTMSWTLFSTTLAKLESYPTFYGVASHITGHSIPWEYLRAADEEEVDARPIRAASISAILTHSRSKLATDAKDKVYALYGIFKTLNVRLAEPDYGKDIVEIYKDATVAAMVCDYSLSILKQAAGHKYVEGLPSWVPDWSDTRIRHFPADSCQAPWKIPLQIAFTPEPDVLVLHGSVAGFVSDMPYAGKPTTFDMVPPTPESDQEGLDDLARSYVSITKTLRDWVHKVLYHRHGVDGLALLLMQGRPLGPYQSAFHQWLRFLMAGWPGWSRDEVYREHNFHQHGLAGLEMFYENDALRYWTEQLEWQVFLAIHANDEARAFHRIVCEALNGRVLFTCRSAGALNSPMVCLSTQEVQYGDWIVLFAGAEFPMMMRPTARNVAVPQSPRTPLTPTNPAESTVHDYYTLVGPVYVVGMMHGAPSFALDRSSLDAYYLI